MADWEVIRGNYGWGEVFTVQNADATMFDLTGYTVMLRAWKQDAAAVSFTGTCVVSAYPASGTATYTVASGVFNTEGDYHFRLELTKTGTTLKTDLQTIQVIDDEP